MFGVEEGEEKKPFRVLSKWEQKVKVGIPFLQSNRMCVKEELLGNN